MAKLLLCIFIFCVISGTFSDEPVEITEFDFDKFDDDSYSFRYVLSDGTEHEEKGINVATSRYRSRHINGTLSYIDDNGDEQSIEYSAIFKAYDPTDDDPTIETQQLEMMQMRETSIRFV